jgi:hypothetical protein
MEFNIEQGPDVVAPLAAIGLGGDVDIVDDVHTFTSGGIVVGEPLSDVIRITRPIKTAMITTHTLTGPRLIYNVSIAEMLRTQGRRRMFDNYGLTRFEHLCFQLDFSANPMVSGVFRMVYVPGVQGADNDDSFRLGNSLDGVDVLFGESNTSGILKVPMIHNRNYYTLQDVNFRSNILGRFVIIQYTPAISEGAIFATTFVLNTWVEGFEGHNPVAQAQGPLDDFNATRVLYYPGNGPFNGITDIASLTPGHSMGTPLSGRDMEISSIVRHKFYNSTVTWLRSNAVGTVLYQRTLAPSDLSLIPLNSQDPANANFKNILDLLSFHSAYFSGNLKFKFLFSNPLSAKGKIKIVLSQGDPTAPSTDLIGIEQWPYAIFDIGACRKVCVEMSAYRDTPLKLSIRPAFFGFNNLNVNACLDMITVFVETPLVSSGPISVDMHVFIGGAASGPNKLKFYLPRSIQMGNSPVAQVVDEIEEEPDCVKIGASSTEVREMPSGLCEVVDLRQLLDLKDMFLFRKPNDATYGKSPFFQIPVTPQLYGPVPGRNNKLFPWSMCFAGWKGSLEYYLNSEVNVTKCEVLPWTAPDPELVPLPNRFSGVLSGMQVFAGVATAQGFAVRDNCPNNWNSTSSNYKLFGRRDRVPLIGDSNEINQMLIPTCYDAATFTPGHFLQLYMGAGADFEFLHYRGFNFFRINSYYSNVAAVDLIRDSFGTDTFPVNWGFVPAQVSSEASKPVEPSKPILTVPPGFPALPNLPNIPNLPNLPNVPSNRGPQGRPATPTELEAEIGNVGYNDRTPEEATVNKGISNRTLYQALQKQSQATVEEGSRSLDIGRASCRERVLMPV